MILLKQHSKKVISSIWNIPLCQRQKLKDTTIAQRIRMFPHLNGISIVFRINCSKRIIYTLKDLLMERNIYTLLNPFIERNLTAKQHIFHYYKLLSHHLAIGHDLNQTIQNSHQFIEISVNITLKQTLVHLVSVML